MKVKDLRALLENYHDEEEVTIQLHTGCKRPVNGVSEAPLITYPGIINDPTFLVEDRNKGTYSVILHYATKGKDQ